MGRQIKMHCNDVETHSGRQHLIVTVGQVGTHTAPQPYQIGNVPFHTGTQELCVLPQEKGLVLGQIQVCRHR